MLFCWSSRWSLDHCQIMHENMNIRFYLWNVNFTFQIWNGLQLLDPTVHHATYEAQISVTVLPKTETFLSYIGKFSSRYFKVVSMHVVKSKSLFCLVVAEDCKRESHSVSYLDDKKQHIHKKLFFSDQWYAPLRMNQLYRNAEDILVPIYCHWHPIR